MSGPSRRSLLAVTGTLVGGGFAGCLGVGDDATPLPTTDGDGDGTDGGGGGDGGDGTTGDDGESVDQDSTEIPLRASPLYVHDAHETLRDAVRGGGPGKDGIPSIDDPSFEPVDEVGDRLLDGTPVFQIEIDGEAKAYPQTILVWHEIVNDTVGGLPLAVSYCPLTGTTIGYERGPVEFGVSGKLLNANLVMYDRETDSRWPQVLGTAIRGDLEGASLNGHPMAWTPWERFREAHPDGLVLTEDTGSVRDYGRDPYGDYNPKRGYYQSDSFLFAPERESDLLHPKAIVHGVRTTDGGFAVEAELLASERVVAGTAGSTPVVVVYDASLETGVTYANPDDVDVVADGDQYVVGGDTHAARDLPLERLASLDAMWFAWYAFYPESDVQTLDGRSARVDRGGTNGWLSTVGDRV